MTEKRQNIAVAASVADKIVVQAARPEAGASGSGHDATRPNTAPLPRTVGVVAQPALQSVAAAGSLEPQPTLRLAAAPSEPVTAAGSSIVLPTAAAQNVQGLAPATAPLSTAAAATGTPAAGRVKPSKVKMSGVERIRLRVLGNPDMNGEYSVDPDFTLSIPGIGRIDVGDLTPAELENTLSELLSTSVRREMKVSVEVTRSRPFFIMGQVGQAGAIEWRPGLNVIQAIALAGGVVRTGMASTDNGVQGQQARAQLNFATAQLQRLKAERSGKPGSGGQSGSSRSAALYPHRTALDQQRVAFDARVVAIEGDRQEALRELQASKTVLATVIAQLENSRAAISDLENMRARKLISNRGYLSQRTEFANMENKVADTRLLVDRAEARIASLTRQSALAKQEREAQLSSRIEALEQEIAQLQPAAAAGATGGTMALEYFIARAANGAVQTTVATVFSEVLQGDVVIVSQREQTEMAALDGRPGQVREANSNTQLSMTQRVVEASAQTRQTSTGQPDRAAMRTP